MPYTAPEEANRKRTADAFDRWSKGTGSGFDLLHEDAEWTIAGSSQISGTYRGKKQLADGVSSHFVRKLRPGAKPIVHGIYVDGDFVTVRYDFEAVAIDGIPYRNNYVWLLEFRDGAVIRGEAFFDSRLYDELWQRVQV